MNFFRNYLALAAFSAFVLFAAGESSAAVIKFATLAPEGSAWMDEIRSFAKDVKEKTGGKVRFRIYGGGIQGDEKDVVRKMRIGQIHCAAFTGVGIGEVAPAVRILDTPFLFRNEAEIDYIYRKFDRDFRKIFEKSGYVFLGWAEVGAVNILSNFPVEKPSDLGKVKLWVWEGDPVAEAAFRNLGAKPIPLSITDVMTSLETGMINAVYASPLSAIALQWFTKMKYMMEMPITNSSGAVLITKKKFMRLSESQRKILVESGKRHFRKLTEISRSDNRKALETLKKNGIKIVSTPPEYASEFEKSGEKTRRSLAGRLYSAEFMEKVEKALSDYRRKKEKKPKSGTRKAGKKSAAKKGGK